jgi:hypothetical protein
MAGVSLDTDFAVAFDCDCSVTFFAAHQFSVSRLTACARHSGDGFLDLRASLARSARKVFEDVSGGRRVAGDI